MQCYYEWHILAMFVQSANMETNAMSLYEHVKRECNWTYSWHNHFPIQHKMQSSHSIWINHNRYISWEEYICHSLYKKQDIRGIQVNFQEYSCF